MRIVILMIVFMSMACLIFAGGHQENTKQIIVFTAASTADLIEDAAGLYSKTTDIEIKLNPASSGTCAKQLEQGAFADIYISASEKWIEYVDELGLLIHNFELMENSLVIITPTESSIMPFEITADTAIPIFEGRISIADPAHAPAGKYALEAMKSCGWYTEISDRILPGPDVRRALSVIEFGEAELGIVYKTDAEKSDQVKIVAVFPADTHSPIRYYCGLTTDASEAASDFYNFLRDSTEVAKLLESHGFTGPGSS